jgi:hypothetical protein
MIETLVRARCSAAIPLAEAMVTVLREMPGPWRLDEEAWYAEACWARAAIEHGMSDLPDVPETAAALHAAPLVPGEPVGLWGLRVARDAAPVRLVYLLEVAARLRIGDYPARVPRTASRVARTAVADWSHRLAWCEGMLYGLGDAAAYLAAAVRPAPPR